MFSGIDRRVPRNTAIAAWFRVVRAQDILWVVKFVSQTPQIGPPQIVTRRKRIRANKCTDGHAGQYTFEVQKCRVQRRKAGRVGCGVSVAKQDRRIAHRTHVLREISVMSCQGEPFVTTLWVMA